MVRTAVSVMLVAVLGLAWDLDRTPRISAQQLSAPGTLMQDPAVRRALDAAKGTEPQFGAQRYVAYVQRQIDDVPQFADLGEADRIFI